MRLKEVVLQAFEKARQGSDKTIAVVVRGYPGAGKTTQALRLVRSIPAIWIIAMPRRSLRRWIVQRLVTGHHRKLMDQPPIFRARTYDVVELLMKDELDGCPLKDEVKDVRAAVIEALQHAPDIAEQIRRLPLPCVTWFFCMYVCSKRKEGKCPFIRELVTCATLARIRHHVIFSTTFVGAALLSTFLRSVLGDASSGKIVAVVDEFDEVSTLFESYAIPRKVVEMLKLYPDLENLAERIERVWIYDPFIDAYVPPLTFCDAHVAVLLSATPLTEIVEAARNIEVFKEVRLELVKPEKDEVLYLPMVYNLEDLERLKPTVLDLVRFLVRTANRYGLDVGIVAPNKRFAHELVEFLSNNKIYAYYGDDRRRAERYRNVIIVPCDRLYRGFSMDKPVVIAFFQGWQDTEPTKKIHIDVVRHLNHSSIHLTMLLHKMNLAVNVQALFRFVRNPRVPHIIVVLDGRMMTALKHFMQKYLERHTTVHRFDTINSLKPFFEALCSTVSRTLAQTT